MAAQPSAWLSATLDPIEEGVAATRLALMPGSTLEAGPSPEEDVGSTSYTGTQKSSPSAGFRVQEARGNVLMGVADESARFLRDTEASRIGSLTLDQLDADLRWLARAYLNQPLGELFFPTVQLRDVAFALVDPTLGVAQDAPVSQKSVPVQIVDAFNGVYRVLVASCQTQ